MSDRTLIHIDRPDFDTLRAEAYAAVAAELGRIARPDYRASRAAAIMDEADEQIGALKPKRDAAALSLWAYGYVRALELSMGIQKNAWVKTQRKALDLAPGEELPTGDARAAAAHAAGIADLPDAASMLPLVSQDLERARARRDEAQKFRDAAVLVLLAEPYSLQHDQVAEIIGRARTTVTMVHNRAQSRNSPNSL